MRKKLKDRQTLLDLAIQESGSMEGLFDIANKNDISLTGNTETGILLETPEVVNKNTHTVYEQKNIIPATGLSKEEQDDLLFEGIDYIGIEVDFTID